MQFFKCLTFPYIRFEHSFSKKCCALPTHYPAFIHPVDGSQTIQGLVQWEGIWGRGCWGRDGILTGSVWLWLCSRVVWRRDGQREGEGKGEGERHFLVKVSGLSRWGSLEMGPCWKDGKCPKQWFIAKASITLRARVCVCLQWRHPIRPQAVTGWQAGAAEEQCFYFSRRSDGLPRRGWGCPLNGRCHAGRCAHGMWIWGCLLPARGSAAEGAAWLDSRAPAEHISCFWYFFIFFISSTISCSASGAQVSF